MSDQSMNSDDKKQPQQQKKDDETQDIKLASCKMTDLQIGKLISRSSSKGIFIVTHKSKNHIYALKKIVFRRSIKEIQSAVSEIYNLHKLNHPNIVKLYTCFYTDSCLCVLSELIHGCTLSDILKVTPQLPENIIGIITYYILQALKYLSENNTTHLNLKPSNIFFTETCDVKIDYPLHTERSPSSFQSLPSIFCYKSPEELRGEASSLKCDVWSLGTVIYQCALGRFPHAGLSGQNVFSVVNRMANIKANVKVNLQTEYSSEFAEFVEACLTAEPSERATLEQLAGHAWMRRFEREEEREKLAEWRESFASLNGDE